MAATWATVLSEGRRVSPADVVGLSRTIAAQLARRWLDRRVFWVRWLLGVLAVAGWWWQGWWLGLPLLVLAALVAVARRTAHLLLDHVVTPRWMRRFRRQSMEIWEEAGAPVDPLTGIRFAWRLARGRRPQDDVVAGLARFLALWQQRRDVPDGRGAPQPPG